MVDVYCRGCEAVVLLWPTNIEGLTQSPHGMVVHYRCLRGHHGAELVQRARSTRTAA